MIGSAIWDIRVSIDLFLGGIGIALFLFSVILSFYNPARYEKLIKISAYLAPITAGVGLFTLVTELGKPFRMVITYFYVNPQSVTSWGGFIQGAFLAVSAIYAVMLFLNKTVSSLKVVQLIGSFLAVAVGMYHGLLLTSISLPLWADGSVAVLFLVSSLAGGSAFVMMMRSLSTDAGEVSQGMKEVAAATEGAKVFNFNGIFFTLITAQLVTTVFWFIAMNRGSRYQLESIQTMLADYGVFFWVLAVAIGIVVPFAISLFQLITGSRNTMSKGLSMIVFLAVIAGSFALKYIIIEAGQIQVPIQLL
ncbi:NrfD/PsrC family molybdoenzyme membrane anchor subunit [Anaerobacillus isosaccharinicus]|uniref:Polysulfide reductase NrfD n=1 Tax=Anaerobacillus isosaccharinicus TaxID=1532552 RepID=A0A1S2M601_9BACI|nr:NrfD/PsrC family molybdoenzyme membrane anchor subunit [Anaerobacillus isosaccharinicus]MBA5588188.1 polysulfide reductase NrfD [Anaerobacillus isosaccharinicus]QOY38359.1 polysulfide reductase NrfD [Anaerobacillus isosaccharinicus]